VAALASGLVAAIGAADRAGLDVPLGVRAGACALMAWVLDLRRARPQPA
jgi:hypothetical protein